MTATPAVDAVVEAVVRRRQAGPLEVIAVRPGGDLAPMSRALVTRAAERAALAEGLWRLTLTTTDPPEVAAHRLGDVGEAIAVVRVAREAGESVVVKELSFSAGDAAPSVEARLSVLVSDGVAGVARELPAGAERWVELVLPSS